MHLLSFEPNGFGTRDSQIDNGGARLASFLHLASVAQAGVGRAEHVQRVWLPL